MSSIRIVIFLTVVLGITYSAHRYFWARLVRDPMLPEPWARIGLIVIIALGFLLPLAMTLVRLYPSQRNAVWVWLAYVWMGCAFFLLVTLGLGDLVRAVIHRLPRGGAPDDPTRRTLMARTLALATGGTALALSGVATWFGLKKVDLRTVKVPISRLTRGDYTIIQWTDVHVGPTIGREFIEQLVTTTNAQTPDAVVITGDLIDGTVSELGPLLEPIRNLRARDGVFFVTGNHEYFHDAEAWVRFLGTLGVRVLRNERVSLRDDLDLAGIEDWSAGSMGPSVMKPDLDAALASRDRSKAVVLLSHQPRSIDKAADHAIDLQLSGHTHGGQMVPFNFLVRLQQPYVAGLHRHRDSWIYVSCGTGYWGPPMRLGAPAEITRIELSSRTST